MGVPVVATDVGGPTEIVTDLKEGVLLPPCEPERWAAAVERLLQHPQLREEMARRARDRAMREFGLDRHTQAVQVVYEDVLNRVRPRQRLAARS
jgi:glycosyltransferase involved in cell wall biosynthesis